MQGWLPSPPRPASLPTRLLSILAEEAAVANPGVASEVAELLLSRNAETALHSNGAPPAFTSISAPASLIHGNFDVGFRNHLRRSVCGKSCWQLSGPPDPEKNIRREKLDRHFPQLQDRMRRRLRQNIFAW